GVFNRLLWATPDGALEYYDKRHLFRFGNEHLRYAAGRGRLVGAARVLVAKEPRSISMRLGAHAQALAPSLQEADAVVFLHRSELAWDAAPIIAQ
ncbi:hypothetical protein ACDH50_20425, partial [Xanthomonas fragariae]